MFKSKTRRLLRRVLLLDKVSKIIDRHVQGACIAFDGVHGLAFHGFYDAHVIAGAGAEKPKGARRKK
jgi:hypothetical protein